jgi:predicted enzyme related to lactoylglutathione lyase
MFATGVVVGLLAGMPATADAQGLASSIANPPTNAITPGKVVWADLVTADVDVARRFYTEVFGWKAQGAAGADYVELWDGEEAIASIAAYEEPAAEGEARWLVSLSVADVDAAASRIERANGQVLEAPQELPDRGRLAVVADHQGAVLMLLRASGGDPEDAGVRPGSWGWAELWTRDVGRAIEFYGSVFGYDSKTLRGEDGQDRTVLASGGKVRAAVVPIPWEKVEPNWLPYVPVENARETLAKVEAAGGRVLLTTDDVDIEPGEPFAAIVADPTGGVFGIQQWGATP